MKTFWQSCMQACDSADNEEGRRAMRKTFIDNSALITVLSTGLDIYMESMLNTMSEKIEANIKRRSEEGDK